MLIRLQTFLNPFLNYLFIYLFIYLFNFFFLTEIESGRGAEREKEILSRLHAQHGARCGVLFHNPEIMT